MSLTLDINAFAKRAGASTDTIVRKVCLDLLTKVVLKTPVDTGRARANWQASIGSPAMGQLAKADKVGQATIAGSLDAIAQATGNIFWVSNNLPYISMLEYGLYSDGPKTIGGFSKQAPSGMVRISISEVQRALR